MAVFEIPITPDPSQVLTVALGGEDFVLTLDWNERQASWSLDVRSSVGDVALGLRLLPGTRLLRRRAFREDKPAGELIVLGTEDGSPPGLEDFTNGPAQLLFLTGEDAVSIAGAGLA